MTSIYTPPLQRLKPSETVNQERFKNLAGNAEKTKKTEKAKKAKKAEKNGENAEKKKAN